MSCGTEVDLFPTSTTQRLLMAAWAKDRKATARLILDCELDGYLTAGQKRMLCLIAGRDDR